MGLLIDDKKHSWRIISVVPILWMNCILPEICLAKDPVSDKVSKGPPFFLEQVILSNDIESWLRGIQYLEKIENQTQNLKSPPMLEIWKKLSALYDSGDKVLLEGELEKIFRENPSDVKYQNLIRNFIVSTRMRQLNTDIEDSSAIKIALNPELIPSNSKSGSKIDSIFFSFEELAAMNQVKAGKGKVTELSNQLQIKLKALRQYRIHPPNNRKVPTVLIVNIDDAIIKSREVEFLSGKELSSKAQLSSNVESILERLSSEVASGDIRLLLTSNHDQLLSTVRINGKLLSELGLELVGKEAENYVKLRELYGIPLEAPIVVLDDSKDLLSEKLLRNRLTGVPRVDAQHRVRIEQLSSLADQLHSIDSNPISESELKGILEEGARRKLPIHLSAKITDKYQLESNEALQKQILLAVNPTWSSVLENPELEIPKLMKSNKHEELQKILIQYTSPEFLSAVARYLGNTPVDEKMRSLVKNLIMSDNKAIHPYLILHPFSEARATQWVDSIPQFLQRLERPLLKVMVKMIANEIDSVVPGGVNDIVLSHLEKLLAIEENPTARAELLVSIFDLKRTGEAYHRAIEAVKVAISSFNSIELSSTLYDLMSIVDQKIRLTGISEWQAPMDSLILALFKQKGQEHQQTLEGLLSELSKRNVENPLVHQAIIEWAARIENSSSLAAVTRFFKSNNVDRSLMIYFVEIKLTQIMLRGLSYPWLSPEGTKEFIEWIGEERISSPRIASVLSEFPEWRRGNIKMHPTLLATLKVVAAEKYDSTLLNYKKLHEEGKYTQFKRKTKERCLAVVSEVTKVSKSMLGF